MTDASVEAVIAQAIPEVTATVRGTQVVLVRKAADKARPNVKITGTVRDADGVPLVGATLIVEGTTLGMSTGANGEYTLNVPANGKIVCSYLGYDSVTETVNARTRIDFQLRAAANSIEDMGWYVVDNMPPKLLVPLVDMMTSSGSNIHKLAAVIDVRSRDYFDDLSAVLSHLDDLGVKTRILFLDASNEVLIKRYESVRRPHPLQQGNRLIDGILEERDLLKNLKEHADIVIDTSALSIHQLSTKLYEGLLGSGPTTVSVHIFSFGFKYGIPIDADFVADVRFLPNPFWVPELRSLTGKDKPVSDYVLSSEGAEEFLDAYEKAIAIAIEGYAQEDKHYVTIAFGCTGGQHRSVAMSEALAKRLRARGLTVSVSARELDKRSAD